MLRRPKAAPICAVLLSLSCRAPRPAVAPEDVTPRVNVTPKRLPAGGPLAVAYSWDVGRAAQPIPRGYRAFVHFVDPEGVPLFSDDHVPSPPPESWEPGQTYAYSRILLSRPFPHTGDVTVLIGLYPESGGRPRLALRGDDRGQRAYRVDHVVLLPRDRELVPRCEGLHDPEPSARAPLEVARFLKREATCSFRNPREDVVLFIQGGIDPRGFTAPPVLTVAADGMGRELPLVLTDEITVSRVRFRASQLGQRPRARVRLAMSASYVPAELGLNEDRRELSFHLFGLQVVRAGNLDPALLTGAEDAVRLRPSAQ